MTMSAKNNCDFDMTIDGVIEQKDLLKGNSQTKLLCKIIWGNKQKVNKSVCIEGDYKTLKTGWGLPSTKWKYL